MAEVNGKLYNFNPSFLNSNHYEAPINEKNFLIFKHKSGSAKYSMRKWWYAGEVTSAYTHTNYVIKQRYWYYLLKEFIVWLDKITN